MTEPLLMCLAISQSVGAWEKGAKNLLTDVIAVQELLTAAAIAMGHSDFDPKGIDGKIARPSSLSRTVKAIIAFQKTFMTTPDGLIEPQGKTLWKLNDLAASEPEPPPKLDRPLKTTELLCFPLSFVPGLSYKKKNGGKRWFGAKRDGGRLHAACDLIARPETPVYAVDDGEVELYSRRFYSWEKEPNVKGYVGALQIRHPHFIARYCEIKDVAPDIEAGVEVKRGQLIAFVGKMKVDSMLHFEMYSGELTGPLSQSTNPQFYRRPDLLDPTPYLELWERNLPSKTP